MSRMATAIAGASSDPPPPMGTALALVLTPPCGDGSCHFAHETTTMLNQAAKSRCAKVVCVNAGC